MTVSRFTALLASFLFLSGCATSFDIKVDSLATPEAISKTRYVVAPASQNVNVNDLQFIEFSGYVERALTKRGFIRVDSFEHADIVVFMAYGIGDPQLTPYSVSIPQWGKTGVSGSRTTGTMNTFGNTATYSGTTTYTPTYGVTGYQTVSGTRVTYFRYLVLDALDVQTYKDTQELRQVWQTVITSSGWSGDLRRVMPLLVVAGERHLATNTGKQVPVTLTESNKRVRALTTP